MNEVLVGCDEDKRGGGECKKTQGKETRRRGRGDEEVRNRDKDAKGGFETRDDWKNEQANDMEMQHRKTKNDVYVYD